MNTHHQTHTNTNTLVCIVKYRRGLSNTLAHPNSDYVTTSCTQSYVYTYVCTYVSPDTVQQTQNHTTCVFCYTLAESGIIAAGPPPQAHPPTFLSFCRMASASLSALSFSRLFCAKYCCSMWRVTSARTRCISALQRRRGCSLVTTYRIGWEGLTYLSSEAEPHRDTRTEGVW